MLLKVERFELHQIWPEHFNTISQGAAELFYDDSIIFHGPVLWGSLDRLFLRVGEE